MNRTVVVLQPYLPTYRIPLFTMLADRLGESALDLTVVHGMPRADQALRLDQANAPWAKTVRVTRVGSLGGLNLRWKHLGSSISDAALVVCELASTDLTTWRQVLIGASRSVVWGHGMAYVDEARRLDDRLELAIARRARHTMTYAESGRAALVSKGLAADRVTAVGNSTDTVALRRYQSNGAARSAELRSELLVPQRTALFVGGLDTSKRIPFLLRAAKAAHELDPQFALIVAGSGRDAGLIEAHVTEPWLRWMRRATPADLGALSLIVESLWMPGRVGLVAVDALALGIPLLTTSFAYHAPEYEYLDIGTDAFVLTDDPELYAKEATDLANQWRSGGWPVSTTKIPTIEDVAARMATVIFNALT